MRKLRTIRARLLFGFVIIALLPLGAAAVGSLSVDYVNGKQQALEHIESISISRDLALSAWLDSLQNELLIATYSDCAYLRIEVVIDLANENRYLDFYNKAIRNRFQTYVDRSAQLEELFLIDAQGRVALSSDPAREGKELAGLTYVQRALAGTGYISLPFAGGGETGVILANPFSSSQGESKAVLAGRASMETVLALVEDRAGLGSTGRAYLTAADGQILAGDHLTARLGDEVATLAAHPTDGLRLALDTREDVTGFFRDYRNRSVVAVYRWLPRLNAVLVIEQDQSEAFRTIYSTLGITLVVAFSALLLAVLLSLAIVRGIVRPLAELAETSTQIAGGALERVAPVDRDDEIGILARAFNSMTAQLRELIMDLERRVAARTADLGHKALQLEAGARVSREITSILDINELLPAVSELIRKDFGYYGVNIFLLDEKTRTLVYRGTAETAPADVAIDIDQPCLSSLALSSNRPALANDVERSELYKGDPNYPDARADLVVPLRIGDQTIGTLELLSTEVDSFSPDDVVVAQGLGNQIAIAIENARLYEKSRELAVVEERNRMARELHDSMNQSLYSVVLFVGAARKEVESRRYTAVGHFLSRAERMAHQALKETRLLLYELRPQVLAQKGLVGALRQRLETVESQAGIRVDLQVETDVSLPAAVEESLYRILQEILNNSLKHSNATALTLALEDRNGGVYVQVRDNGVGFDLAEGSAKGGMGLSNITERSRELGARMELETAPGEGTCVTILLELPEQQTSG